MIISLIISYGFFLGYVDLCSKVFSFIFEIFEKRNFFDIYTFCFRFCYFYGLGFRDLDGFSFGINGFGRGWKV